MEKITLEKVDEIRERTGISYAKAKEVLELCNGDVLDSLIYIEENRIDYSESNDEDLKNGTISIEELKEWFDELLKKGNVTRIKIKKDDVELVDIPVNAGIAAGVLALAIPSILAAGVIVAIATKITIEITREDGSVEVINKYVSKVANDFKDKANDFADKVKTKVNEVKKETKVAKDDINYKKYDEKDIVYSYKVSFENDEKEKDN